MLLASLLAYSLACSEHCHSLSDYLSLLQSRAQAITIVNRSVSLDLLPDADVPILAGKSRAELNCMLHSALQNTIGFQPVGHAEPQVHHRKCVVVGSSGIMSQHDYGQEIDEAETVFRFNDAPTEGFERHVGSKESIRVVNSKLVREFIENAGGDSLDGKTKLHQMKPGPDYFLKDATLAPSAAKIGPQLHLYAVPDSLLEFSVLKFIQDTYGGVLQTPEGALTTGALGMVAALRLCDEVHAYGMNDDFDSDSGKGNYHYYEPDNTVGSVAMKQIGPFWVPYNSTKVEVATRVHESMVMERDLWRRLSTNPVEEVMRDKVVLQGFSECY